MTLDIPHHITINYPAVCSDCKAYLVPGEKARFYKARCYGRDCHTKPPRGSTKGTKGSPVAMSPFGHEYYRGPVRNITTAVKSATEASEHDKAQDALWKARAELPGEEWRKPTPQHTEPGQKYRLAIGGTPKEGEPKPNALLTAFGGLA